jgi:hypothetical protein
VSEFNPDVSESARLAARSYGDDHPIELAGDSIDDDADDESPARPGSGAGAASREGLPSSYRMRAEDHYVDELLSRPSAAGPDGDPPARAGAPADTVAERQQRILAELAEELASIEHAAALLNDQGSVLARRVGIDLIRAQSRRASWMLRAQAIAAGTHLPNVRPRTIGSLLAEIRDGLAAECRLSGVGLQMQAGDLQATVSVDEHAVVAGVAGAIIASMALVGSQEGATVRVTAVALGGDLRTVEVRQDAVAVGPTARRRFFDETWTDRPGGWMAALAAETARTAARLLGGDATFIVRERRGSTIRLTFSRIV